MAGASSSLTILFEFIVSVEVSSYNFASSKDENSVNMMKSSDAFKQEQAMILLRQITRINQFLAKSIFPRTIHWSHKAIRL
ncbi:Hypothetical predicted protein [Olea europaea subsp. europaea]|uniref:Uncharacterized protein n=1 Tax=Olea europaea subsp. europaea TaxID=158383 RepID=A0A8S0T566_OLEEU|nr:Hypothetical predicted protein [Olea europaea subsp. europaea]